ncbi:MAG: ArdC-like ssDNA-binding domain-containing protein [Kiritimatiellales bacterium]
MTTKSSDINRIITDRFIERIKTTGILPWKQPWTSPALAPKNLISGKMYQGINLFLLHMLGFASPYWLTFKQISDLGGTIRKGEKAAIVVFRRQVKKPLEESEVDDPGVTPRQVHSYSMLRYYYVFNTEQCDGLPKEKLPDYTKIPSPELKSDEALRLMKEMPNPPHIQHNARYAAYNRVTDVIRMPPRVFFHNEHGYWEALFHELIHATGHERRLNRKEISAPSCSQSDEAKEELIAEMGAAFLCAHYGSLFFRLQSCDDFSVIID